MFPCESEYSFLSPECYPSTISREWVLTDTADSTQLATRQRLRAKLEKILATRTAAAAGEGRREESSDRRLREAESRIREAEREKEVSEQRAATRIREAESKVKDVHRYVSL